MIKLLLFLVSLLVPMLSLAQYTPGNYYLNSDPSKVYSGNLKVNPNKLIVQNETDKNFSFQPEEVAYVRTSENKKFVATNGLPTRGPNWNNKLYRPVLVKLIDSGKFRLTRYNNFNDESLTFNSAAGVYDGSLYIVKTAGSTVVLPLYVWTNKGKRLCDALECYVIDRPDLQKLLDEQQIRNENLAAFFHAVNSGQPFPLTELKGKKTKKIKERAVESPFGD